MMPNIPLVKIWLLVKPTIGLPVFFVAVAVTSLIVHAAVLTHTTWYPAFYNGKAKPAVVGLLVPTPGAPGSQALASN